MQGTVTSQTQHRAELSNLPMFSSTQVHVMQHLLCLLSVSRKAVTLILKDAYPSEKKGEIWS